MRAIAMKTPMLRCSSALALLTLAFALALPVQAARVRRSGAPRMETFQTASNTKVVVGTNHAASLANLKVGDRVSISYVQNSGGRLARRITDGVPHKSHTPAKHPAKHPAKTPGLLHAHGVIRAINLQAGTVTIAHK